jgi:hypothetical protein
MLLRVCHKSGASRGLSLEHTFTISRNVDYPAFYMDGSGQNIVAVSTSRRVCVPSMTDMGDGSRVLFDLLADVWRQDAYVGQVEPVYLLVDFGEGVPPGYAVLVPSQEGWDTLAVLGASEFSLEGA